MAGNKELITQTRELNKLLEQQKTLALMLGNMDTARANQAQIESNNQKLIEDLRKNIGDLDKQDLKVLNELEKTEKDINTDLTKQQKLRKTLSASLLEFNRQLKSGWQYLMQSDKIIKTTVLNLGLSGAKAELMRGSFEQSAGFVARLGGSLGDIQSIMETYADETGRARVLSAEMVDRKSVV